MAKKQKLFNKPDDVRYVDMCIYIDNNFYTDHCDYNKAYTYMWFIAYMLAAKQKLFNNVNDYEDFASMLAYSTYQRMTNKNKSEIKSVLNYMKSVIHFRKMTFESQKQQKIIDSKFDDFDSMAYVERLKSVYESSNRDALFDGVKETLERVPSIIKDCIPKVFKSDKVEYNNIYISSLLSFINRITLPSVYDEKLKVKLDSMPHFNEVKYYKKYLDNDIILWHLPDSMEMVIVTIINKANGIIINEINDLTDSVKLSESDFNGIMASGFIEGGTNDTNF